MVNIDDWMQRFTAEILGHFPGRIEAVGLQGSYARREATEHSDLDVVVIFDQLGMEDLKEYDRVISKLPHREKICGFLSGKEEITHWDPSDLVSFCYDTKVVYGEIGFLFSLIKPEHIRQAVWAGGCQLYHACCHNILHEKSPVILKALYKQSVFVLKAKHLLDTGEYVAGKDDLFARLAPQDKTILQRCMQVQAAGSMEPETFDSCSQALWVWAGRLIRNYSRSPQSFS